MKVSTKGRYGLRLVLDIAMHAQEGPVALKTIAQRQQISEKYLEQIIIKLNKNGYLKSMRGAYGGYVLNIPPEELTVGMILRAVEGSMSPVDCVAGKSCCCPREDVCMTVDLWKRVKEAVDSVVDHTTIADLISQAGKCSETDRQC